MNTQQTPTNSTFIENSTQMAKALAEANPVAWLHEYKQSHIALLEQTAFPDKRVEHFKYNRLHAFDECDYNQCLPHADHQISVTDYAIENLDAEDDMATVVFIDGQLQPTLSDSKNHTITDFAETNTQQQQRILELLTAHSVSHNPFTLLNACLTHNGVLIQIDEKSPQTVIEVLHIITDNSLQQTIANQIIIDIADRCKATIITRTVTASEHKQSALSALSTNRIIAHVGNNAHFNHYHLPLENSESLHFGSVCYNLHSHTQLNAFQAVTGSKTNKVDTVVNHNGQHAYAKLNGLYVASGNEQVDCHTTVTHPLANGTTNENFRGIINGNGEAVFNGRIHILEDAQKTLAELSNKNLLLSDDCVLHTKPELEIYADDVICAHGATVSRLQEESLAYLRARGIDKAEAEMMLSFAFFDELLEELEIRAIADYIRPILFERFK